MFVSAIFFLYYQHTYDGKEKNEATCLSDVRHVRTHH